MYFNDYTTVITVSSHDTPDCRCTGDCRSIFQYTPPIEWKIIAR